MKNKKRCNVPDDAVIWMNVKAVARTKKEGIKKANIMFEILKKALAEYEPTLSFFVETRAERKKRMRL